MNGLYFIPILAVMLVGLGTRYVPASAAKAALVLGCAAISLGYWLPALQRHVQAVHELHFLALVFCGLVAVMLLIGAVRPRPVPWEQHDAGLVNLTPWRFAWPGGIAILAAVLSIYACFADPSALQSTNPPPAEGEVQPADAPAPVS
jgi:SSS family solute:Na+ symporter